MPRQRDARSYGSVFDEVAEDYDRHRPTYPGLLVDQACEGAGIAPGAAVLEIGCGTGQLTRSLLARGLRVTAVEPGQHLIARARDQLHSVGDVQFVNARLEYASLPRAQYSAVFSASAIHWIDPDVSWRKAADALVDGGSLALVSYFGLDDPRSADDQQALRAAMATVAPELAADWPTYRDLARTLAGVAVRRANVSEVWAWLGAMRSPAGTRRTCLMTRSSPRCRRCWSNRLTRSTLCWARCRSGHGCRPDSATLSPPKTKPSTSGWAGRSALVQSPAW
jgi:SAM-dependent methyltransferase